MLEATAVLAANWTTVEFVMVMDPPVHFMWSSPLRYFATLATLQNGPCSSVCSCHSEDQLVIDRCHGLGQTCRQSDMQTLYCSAT